MDQLTSEALERWKAHRFRATDVPFADAVHSLGSGEDLIVVRQSAVRKNEWLLCRPGTATPTTFVYAAVFSEGDPYETGNFVPNKVPVPEGMDEERVARHPGYKAAYAYAMDTSHDKEIWELQSQLDAHMEGVEGFNSKALSRREWQNGNTWHVRYWWRVPMFFASESHGQRRPEAPETLHEWVRTAHRRSKSYRANPTRPEVCGLEGGRLQKIAQCMPKCLEYGDVVCLLFNMMYVEDRQDWGPVPLVTHIVRVQHANREAYQLSSEPLLNDVVASDEVLEMGLVVDEDAAARADAGKQDAATSAGLPCSQRGSPSDNVEDRRKGGGVGVITGERAETNDDKEAASGSRTDAGAVSVSDSMMEVDDEEAVSERRSPGVEGRRLSDQATLTNSSRGSSAVDRSGEEPVPEASHSAGKRRARPSPDSDSQERGNGRPRRFVVSGRGRMLRGGR